MASKSLPVFLTNEKQRKKPRFRVFAQPQQRSFSRNLLSMAFSLKNLEGREKILASTGPVLTINNAEALNFCNLLGNPLFLMIVGVFQKYIMMFNLSGQVTLVNRRTFNFYV